eukprot:6206097-Pleurochrysis_carterae.AAC.7
MLAAVSSARSQAVALRCSRRAWRGGVACVPCRALHCAAWRQRGVGPISHTGWFGGHKFPHLVTGFLTLVKHLGFLSFIQLTKHRGDPTSSLMCIFRRSPNEA